MNDDEIRRNGWGTGRQWDGAGPRPGQSGKWNPFNDTFTTDGDFPAVYRTKKAGPATPVPSGIAQFVAVVVVGAVAFGIVGGVVVVGGKVLEKFHYHMNAGKPEGFQRQTNGGRLEYQGPQPAAVKPVILQIQTKMAELGTVADGLDANGDPYMIRLYAGPLDGVSRVDTTSAFMSLCDQRSVRTGPEALPVICKNSLDNIMAALDTVEGSAAALRVVEEEHALVFARFPQFKKEPSVEKPPRPVPEQKSTADRPESGLY